MRKIQPLPIILIVINVLVYFYEVYDPNVVALGAVNFESAITNGQFYRLFTSMFLHGGIEHLAFNMLSLYFMSDVLLNFVSKVKYLIIYFGAGIIGGLLSIIISSNVLGHDNYSIGASGAVMGLLGASIYMLINLKKQGVPLQGTIIRLVIMAAINVIPTSAGVDYTAHLCGLVVGFILALIFVRKDEQNRRERMNSGTGSFDIYR